MNTAEEPTKVCSNCKKDIPESKFRLHDVYCARNVSKCSCGEMVDKKDKEEHMKDVHEKVTCKHCGLESEKFMYKDHDEICTMKPKPCPYCESTIGFAAYDEHVKQCGCRTKQCSRCDRHILVRDYADHMKSDCLTELLRLKEAERQETLKKLTETSAATSYKKAVAPRGQAAVVENAKSSWVPAENKPLTSSVLDSFMTKKDEESKEGRSRLKKYADVKGSNEASKQASRGHEFQNPSSNANKLIQSRPETQTVLASAKVPMQTSVSSNYKHAETSKKTTAAIVPKPTHKNYQAPQMDIGSSSLSQNKQYATRSKHAEVVESKTRGKSRDKKKDMTDYNYSVPKATTSQSKKTAEATLTQEDLKRIMEEEDAREAHRLAMEMYQNEGMNSDLGGGGMNYNQNAYSQFDDPMDGGVRAPMEYKTETLLGGPSGRPSADSMMDIDEEMHIPGIMNQRKVNPGLNRFKDTTASNARRPAAPKTRSTAATNAPQNHEDEIQRAIEASLRGHGGPGAGNFNEDYQDIEDEYLKEVLKKSQLEK